jgi:hypothetical protein
MIIVSIAALIAWLITVGLGSYMVRVWLTNGGTSKPGASHFAAARVFTHLGLAVAGLILWVIYLAVGGTVLAWIAFVDLVLVASLGGLLVNRWRSDGRAAMAGGAGSAPDLAEQHIQRTPVVLHGVCASVTLILVLLAALGVG